MFILEVYKVTVYLFCRPEEKKRERGCFASIVYSFPHSPLEEMSLFFVTQRKKGLLRFTRKRIQIRTLKCIPLFSIHSGRDIFSFTDDAMPFPLSPLNVFHFPPSARHSQSQNENLLNKHAASQT